MTMGHNDPVFAIGIVARMVGLHQQTLRNYERCELVVPRRSSGGTRLYSNRDVELIRKILEWKEEFGLNLADELGRYLGYLQHHHGYHHQHFIQMMHHYQYRTSASYHQ